MSGAPEGSTESGSGTTEDRFANMLIKEIDTYSQINTVCFLNASEASKGVNLYNGLNDC